MSTDRQFFDLFMLIIGILIGVTFGLWLLAQIVTSYTQDEYVLDDPQYQAEVLARIRPVGEVALPGQEPTPDEVAPVAETQPVAEMMSGPQVYNTACLACHGAGVGGAPKIGDIADWAPRIAQGMEVMQDHVINGYQGDLGYMPPKGGRIDLPDEEILAAMNYMVEESS